MTKVKTILPLAIGAVLVAVLVMSHSRSQAGLYQPLPVRSTSNLPVATAVIARSTINSPAGDSLLKLREMSSNPRMTAEGAITSYEIRGMIADRLRTNEAFCEWATSAVVTAVCNLAQNPNFSIYGTTGLSSNDLNISVDVVSVGGLRGTASYAPDTNSEESVEFVVEGGTNACVSMVQNRCRAFDYQTDEANFQTPTNPGHVGHMDWGNAKQPLSTNQLVEMSREAYSAMTGKWLAGTVQAKIDESAVIDPTIADPSVQVIGTPGARVATTLNRRYPYAWVSFAATNASFQPFNGELFQTRTGRGEFVKMIAFGRSKDQVQTAVFQLADQFLTPESTNWAQEVLTNVGSTPPDQVLKKTWKMPER